MVKRPRPRGMSVEYFLARSYAKLVVKEGAALLIVRRPTPPQRARLFQDLGATWPVDAMFKANENRPAPRRPQGA